MAAGFFGTSAGIVLGGLLCLGLVLLGIAAAVILSLISVFTPNNSVEGYGDAFRINYLMLKSLYAHETTTNHQFNNGTIAENTLLSTLCATMYRNLGEKNVAGCIIQNSKGWGPDTNSTSSRRRRRALETRGLISLSEARIFYSTSCGLKSDIGKYSVNETSSCTRTRLEACNKLFNNTEGTFVEWTPVPTSFFYSIVESTLTSYITLTVSRVFGVRPSNAISQATSRGITNSTILTQLVLGCQYEGSYSQATIASLIAAQSTATTTLPTSTQPIG